MTTFQTGLFGDKNTSTIKRDVELVLEKYPAARSNNRIFARGMVRKRGLLFVAQLDEYKQNQLYDFMYEFLSMDRERRDLIKRDNEAKI